MGTRPVGWYADPVTAGAARYWNGDAWTQQIAWGERVAVDPTPLADVIRAEERSRAAIIDDYLADARRRNVASPAAINALRVDVQRPGAAAPATAPSAPPVADTPALSTRPSPVPSTARPHGRPSRTAAPARTPAPAGLTAPTGLPAPTGQPAGASAEQARAPSRPTTPIPRRPGRLAQWWADAHRTVRSDLALHGLAYLGVLLLFAGVSGLIIFSFGEVTPWLRPVAELVVPAALFVSAWYLGRRGASVVAASLTFLGGALVPLVVATSFTDGVKVPPDLSGPALPIVQGAAVAAVAVVYALVALRRPSSPLRHLAAPVLWMAFGIVAGVWRDPIPSGYETARADALQLAVVLAAIALTAMACARSWGPPALTSATDRLVLPTAGAVLVLELIVAGGEGWPLASTIVAGLAALVVAELSAEQLRPVGTTIAQVGIVLITAARLAAVGAPQWVAAGALVVLLGIVEHQGRQRPTPIGTIAGLAAVGVVAPLLVVQPAPAAAAFGALTLWGLWRHIAPPAWLPFRDPGGVLPAAAAAVATAELWDLGEPNTSLVATAAAVVAIAGLGRVWRPDDLLWRWFVPSSAAAVLVVSMTFAWGEAATEVAIAAALVSVAFVLSRLPVAARAWLTAGALVWALANAAAALDIAPSTQAIALGAAALVLVVVAVVTARPIGIHLATIGHVAGLGAMAVVSWPGWSATVVVASATLAWLTVTFVDERGEAIHLAALRRVLAQGAVGTGIATDEVELDHDATTPDPQFGLPAAVPVVGQVAPLLTFAGVIAAAALAADASGWRSIDDPWVGVVVVGLVAVAAGVVRIVSWRRAHPVVLSWATLIVAAGTVGAVIDSAGRDRGQWAPVVALTLGLVVTVAPAAPRPRPFVWVGWATGGVLAMFVVDRLGLDRDALDLAAGTWGALALLGALSVHRRRYGAAGTEHVDVDPLLLPPAVLGTAAFVVGGGLGLIDGSDTAVGWTAAAMAAVVLAAAILIPLGVLVALTEVLATLAVTLLAPWEPLDHPWAFAPWVGALLAVALATRRDRGAWSRRWDLPSFVVAHAVALAALAAAVETDTIGATWAAFGIVSMAVWAVLRRWPWAAGGALLVLVAAGDAGHGWLAAVLLVEGVAVTIVGLASAGRLRWGLTGLGAVALIGAWFDLATWLEWSDGTVFLATMPTAAAIAVGAAVARRTDVVPTELASVWTIAGSALAISISGLVEAADRRPGGITMSASLLLLAIAAAILAPLLGARVRWVATALAAVAWLPLRWALQPSDVAVVLVGTTIAVVFSVAIVALHRRRPDAVWLAPAAGYGAVAQLGAAAAATAALPDTGLLLVVLIAISAELHVLGLLQTGDRRWALLGLAASATVGAWWSAAAWLEWSTETTFVVTVPGAAAVATLAALAMRRTQLPVELAAVHAVAGSLVAIGTMPMVDEVGRRPGGLAAAGGFLLLAVAAGTLATMLHTMLRWVAALLAAAGTASVAWALEPTAPQATVLGTGLALGVFVLALALHGLRPDTPWLLPASGFGTAIQVGAIATALTTLPDTGSLVVVLLAIAAELVAVGVLTDRPELFVLAPAAACAAWLVYAQEALRGNANWFTVPIGLTLLVTVGLLRWVRAWRGGDVGGWDVISLELLGMGFLVGSPLARTLGGALWNGLIAIAIGVLVAGWGAGTRVRWRAGFGAATVVLAVLLLIGVPLSDAVTWRGPALWIVLSLVGIAAIVLATALESSRDRLRRLAVRLEDMTDGWERMPIHHHDAGDDHHRQLPPPTIASGAC